MIDPGRDNTNFKAFDSPRREEDSEFEEDSKVEELDDPLEPSEYACLNKDKKEKVASGIQQLILQD